MMIAIEAGADWLGGVELVGYREQATEWEIPSALSAAQPFRRDRSGEGEVGMVEVEGIAMRRV
jgi:hypothetical protein